MEVLKNNKNTIIYLIFIVLFIICGYFVGINHESWADEAQHWLLARDCGILELINQRLKYEGHPLLWYLILKVFIFFKLPYEKFFNIDEQAETKEEVLVNKIKKAHCIEFANNTNLTILSLPYLKI